MTIFRPFRDGRWLAWLMHELALCDSSVPSRRKLRWNVRSVRQRQADHYWSEGESAGVAPCVESHLAQYDVTPFFGEPYTLWRTSMTVQVVVQGKPASFERERSFGNEAMARADFMMHRHEVRAGLAGSRLFPARSTT